MFKNFPTGTKVRVIEDGEDPESGWVGAIGVVQKHNVFDRNVTLQIISGNPNPEDGDLAWFAVSELEALES